jgi:hypothetical protein
MLICFGVGVALVIGEMALRVREHLSRSVNGYFGADTTVKDARLGYRVPPNTPGHDSLGFRNQSVPTQADIVAIGDSQTWGNNVSRDDAWPQVLGRISGRSVYNMALGGYGPVEYWVLSQDAEAFSPDVLVVALYFGNDFYDAYRMVYQNDLYASFRATGSADLAHDTLRPESDLLYDEMVASSAFPHHGRIFNFAIHHSATARALALLREPDDAFAAAKAWALAHPNHGAVYEHNQVRTVLTTAYRLSALDLDEPRISEGLRISKEMLLLMSNFTAKSGEKLLVGLIPTKEMVFASGTRFEEATRNPTYAKLVRMETLNRQALMSFCEEHHIAYLDLLVPLASAVARNEQIYLTTADGHPNKAGYLVIASAFADRLKVLQW